MSRIPWDPDVNITRRKPSGMTSKVSSDEEDGIVAPPKSSAGRITKSKQKRVQPKLKTRLGVHGNDKAQSVVLMKHWEYRSFKRCGNCGEYDTYKSRNPAWTRTMVTKKLSEMFPILPPMVSMSKAQDGVDANTTTYDVEVEVLYWCYKCGAINDAVIDKYADDGDFVAKEQKNFCAECGKDICFAKGDKAFPTGDKDPITGKSDFNCEDCNAMLVFYAKNPEMRPKEKR